MELSELSSYQEASLFRSGLEEWQEGPQVLTYGAILICRKGKAMLNVNYKDIILPCFAKQACSWSRRCILPCGKTAAGRIPLW